MMQGVILLVVLLDEYITILLLVVVLLPAVLELLVLGDPLDLLELLVLVSGVGCYCYVLDVFFLCWCSCWGSVGPG